jgi:hypothetical protein
VKGTNVTSAVCHCKHCQKQTASAFSAVLIVPLNQLSIEGQLAEYRDLSEDGRFVARRFCPGCGSPVQTFSSALEKAGVTIVKAGLMENGAAAPQFEMFCSRALSWIPNLGEHPRFEEAIPL